MAPATEIVGQSPPVQKAALQQLLAAADPAFWKLLREASWQATSFDKVAGLSTLRRRAQRAQLPLPAAVQLKPLRLAMLGACSLYPLHELVQHYLYLAGEAMAFDAQLMQGGFDNYTSEILDPGSALYQFEPQAILLMPSVRRCRYDGHMHDEIPAQREQALATVTQLLDLCRVAHERTRAEVLLANFPLPSGHDPGPLRTRTLASDWSFRKLVNLEMGLAAPPYVHIVDWEFLSARRGTLASTDEKAWFESKQPGSPDFLVDAAREVAHLMMLLRQGPKKVAVLDLDNTLWGGVIGDDGLDGIDLGETSARGEAFRSFQQYLLSLSRRGVLLGVASKNDHDKAMEPFESHTEMVLRPGDIVNFKANWNPKPENIRQMAAELNLGLDSFVFIDDNPAEIEIVRQFAPEVTGILLGEDPAGYAAQVQETRLFDPREVTAEDAARVQQYRQEAQRQALQSSFTGMDDFLQSLEMTGVIAPFSSVDAPRISQLIGRSNQFNLTTRRRTEAEVREVAANPASPAFTIRVADRFGDYGLIAVVVGHLPGDGIFHIDTWLMSCRVLKRQVEDETVNEIMRLAARAGCHTVRGQYLPTKKNGMVRDLYPQMGFTLASAEPDGALLFERPVAGYEPKPSKIQILRPNL